MLCVSPALSQPQSPSSQGEVGVWTNIEDATDLYRDHMENPFLKKEIDFLNQQHLLDEREKAFLREKIDFEKEKTALAEQKEKAAKDAIVGITQINQEQKGVIKQLEKDVKKAKLLGYAGVGIGIVIAVIAVVLAL